MDQKDFARLGGYARAKKLSQKKLKEIGRKGGLASARKRAEAKAKPKPKKRKAKAKKKSPSKLSPKPPQANDPRN